MKIRTKIYALLLTIGLISCQGSTQESNTKKPETESDFSGMENSIFPKPIGIINDYAHIFTETQKNELSQMLYNYDIETTRQIAIVTVDSIKPYTEAQKYAVGLAKKWGVGNSEKNNGLVIVLCNPIRQIGIATGTGTQLILTDKICNNVIQNTMIPEFKNKKYYVGIKKGILQLIDMWQ